MGTKKTHGDRTGIGRRLITALSSLNRCLAEVQSATSQPARANDHSPRIHPWVTRHTGASPLRDGRSGSRGLDSVAPRGWGKWEPGDPPLKRWAIFGCPSGTNTNGGVKSPKCSPKCQVIGGLACRFNGKGSHQVHLQAAGDRRPRPPAGRRVPDRKCAIEYQVICQHSRNLDGGAGGDENRLQDARVLPL